MTRNGLKTILVSFLVTGVLGMYPPSGAAGPFAEALKAGAKAYAKAGGKPGGKLGKPALEAVKTLQKYFGQSGRVNEILDRLNNQNGIIKFSRGPVSIEDASKYTVRNLMLKHSSTQLTAAEKAKFDEEIRAHLEELTKQALHKTYGYSSQHSGSSSMFLATNNIEKLYSHVKKDANLLLPSGKIIMEAGPSRTVFRARGTAQPTDTVTTDSTFNISINAVLSGH